MLGSLANLVVNIVINSSKFNAQMNDVHNRLTKFQALSKSFGGFFFFAAAGVALKEYINKLAEIETGFIRIERVAREFKGGGFRKDIFDLAQEISGSSLADIQKIMKISAQLGVRGKENLLEFSRSMAMLANVTGLSADTITTDIGKVIQVFNLLPTDAEKVSNTILQVADDFNVVETEITNIVRRIGAFSNSIGLSVEETVAFAGAMKDIGVNTEIAASSLYTFFARLQTEPVAIGKFFGYTNKELFTFFKLLRQKPSEAIIKLLEKIRDMPPSERLAFFEKLELYGVRNAAALGTLAEKLDRLKLALDSANKGAEENIRLMEGQWDRMNSIAGKIDDMSDAWNRFLVTFSNTDVIKNTFSVFTGLLLGLEAEIARASGSHKTDVDLSDIKTVTNRVKELRESIKGAELIKRQNLEAATIKIFGREYRPWGFEGLNNIAMSATGHDANKKELKFLETFLKRIEALNRAKLKNEEKDIKDKKPPTDDAVRREFQAILGREKEDKKKKGDSSQFKGFMGLTEAWKNLITDEMEGKDKEFKALKDIHQEEVEGNGHLASIDNNIKNLRMGAILG